MNGARRWFGWRTRMAAATFVVALIAVALVIFARREAVLAEAKRRAEAGDWLNAADLVRPLSEGWMRTERAVRLRAEAARRLGRLAEAELALASLALPKSDDRLERAKILTSLGRPNDAAEEWTRYADAEPSANVELAAFLQRLVDEKQSSNADELRVAVADRPEGAFPEIEVGLAAQLLEAGFPKQASKRVERPLRSFDRLRSASRLKAARVALSSADASSAERLLVDEPAFGPTEQAERFWLLCRAALQRRDATAAAGWLARARSADSANAYGGGTIAEPAPFVGSKACAVCHKAKYEQQRNSHHAHSLAPAASNRFNSFPAMIEAPDLLDKSLRYTINPHTGVDVAADRAGARAATGELAWMVGSGTRGTSFLVTTKDAEIEFALSHYVKEGWDTTAGHAVERDRENPMGRVLTSGEADRCLGCHSTNVEALREARPRLQRNASTLPTAVAEELGVRCESCHGPGGNHVRAVEANFKQDLAILNPARLSAAAGVELCARCHQPSKNVDVSRVQSVRFQSATLRESKCFTASGKLSCVTCHDPHATARRTDEEYGRRCLDCHQRSALSCPPLKSTPRAEATKQEAASCNSCHMPTVAGAMKHTLFTDHRIRVHGDARNKN